jgi:hypothetical protein
MQYVAGFAIIVTNKKWGTSFIMSKASKNKKNEEKLAKTREVPETEGQPVKRYLTDEEKAKIIRDRIANRPVIVFRYRNGRWNRRLIFMLALMIVAMIASVIFLTKYY